MHRADSLWLKQRKLQRFNQGVKNQLSGLVELPEEACREMAEAWKRVLGKSDVVLHAILFAANLITLFVASWSCVLLLQILGVGLGRRLLCRFWNILGAAYGYWGVELSSYPRKAV